MGDFKKAHWACCVSLCLNYIYFFVITRLCTIMKVGNKTYTAISRKVVGKCARDNPERYCGWFWVHCSSKKFERLAREAMDVCLRVLKESNKTWFDSYSVRNSVLIISYITFRDCRLHIFSDNLSRNRYILLKTKLKNLRLIIAPISSVHQSAKPPSHRSVLWHISCYGHFENDFCHGEVQRKLKELHLQRTKVSCW